MARRKFWMTPPNALCSFADDLDIPDYCILLFLAGKK